MSEQSNPTYGKPLEPQSNGSESTPAEEYKVGPSRPPVDTRWKKGGPSPNPHGRPRKEQSMLPDVRKAFERSVNKKVLVPRGDKKVLMTRVEIGLEQLLNQFAKGDRHARRDLMEYADKLGIDFFGQTPTRARGGADPQLPSNPRCVSRTPKRCRKHCAGPACVGPTGTPG